MVLTFLNISSGFGFFFIFVVVWFGFFVSSSLAELSYLFVFSGQFEVKHQMQSLTD